MLNIEKYKKEISKILDKKQGFAIKEETFEFVPCHGTEIMCDECWFNTCLDTCFDTCANAKTNWLMAEYEQECEVALTIDEYDFCKLAKRGYLARYCDGMVGWFLEKPKKHNNEWNNSDVFVVSNFKALKDSFKFIKSDDTEPWDIQKLLKYSKIPTFPKIIFNVDKYRKDIDELMHYGKKFALYKEDKTIRECEDTFCPDCAFYYKLDNGDECESPILKWLFEEYKEENKEKEEIKC